MTNVRVTASTRIFLTVFLAFFAVLGATTYLQYVTMERFRQEALARESRWVTEAIALKVAPKLGTAAENALADELMAVVRQDPSILEITITDETGKPLFAYESPMKGPADIHPVVRTKRLYDPIHGKTEGTLRVVYAPAEHVSLLAMYRYLTWASVAGAALLLLALFLGLRNYLAPLQKLAEHLRGYDPRRHDFPKERIERTDEIAVIHNMVIDMFEKIEKYTGRMFEMNLRLEAKIKERTDILEETNDQLRREIEERTRTEEALKRANEQLERLSTKDPLTGLFNRRMFERTFENYWEMAKRERQPISVMLCDIDHFKQINDRYGHLAGDKCLQELAEILKSVVKRSMDSVARYGGEEFVFVLPDTTLEGALILAKEIRGKIHARNGDTTTEIPFTLSIGVATVVPTGQHRANLLRAADVSLYEAKRKGRDRIEIGTL